jgi:small conductance mechanosensitive channel
VIVLIAWAVQAIASRLIRGFRAYMARRTSAADELQRIDTVGNVFRNFAAVVVVLVAGMLVLNELGISIAPILATAGVAAAALAFGAQSLIKDYFTGFFLLIEDQIRVGDVVELAGRSGQVEEMTLRYVRLRDFDGHVTFVPNGEIKLVVNRTRVFAYAVIDAAVAEEQDIEQVYAVLRDVASGLRGDPRFSARVIEDIEIVGVERWELWGLVVRARMKTAPLEQWNVKREFLRRLKEAFLARGIKTP